MYNVENNLWELQKATNRYKDIDPLADWVLFAISRYINTGRATPLFLKKFSEYKPEKFTFLIQKCLNGDRSDDGILKTCKRILCQY